MWICRSGYEDGPMMYLYLAHATRSTTNRCTLVPYCVAIPSDVVLVPPLTRRDELLCKGTVSDLNPLEAMSTGPYPLLQVPEI